MHFVTQPQYFWQTLPTFSFNPYPGGNHLIPASQFVLSQHSFFKCWYILFTSMWKYYCFSCLILRSASFLHVAQVLTLSVCLPAALQVSEILIFHISTTFCCGLLWKLGVEKEREHVLTGEYSSFVSCYRKNFLSLYKFCDRLMEASCSPVLKWCSMQPSKRIGLL